MASQPTPSSFDDLQPVEQPNTNRDSEDAEWFDLEPGATIVGEIREVTPDCGEHDTTVLKLARGLGDVVLMWSNRQIDRQLEHNDLGEGDVIGIRKSEDTETFTTEDGETRTYHACEVRSVGGS